MNPEPSEDFERELFALRAASDPAPHLDLDDLFARVDAHQQRTERGRWARVALIAGNALAAAAACLLLIQPSVHHDPPSTPLAMHASSPRVAPTAAPAEPLLCGADDEDAWCRMPVYSPATNDISFAGMEPASETESYATHAALVSCPAVFMCTSDPQPTL